MRHRPRPLQVSTFPFLAVLLCAMGSLMLLLLVIDRRAKAVTRARALRAAEEIQTQASRATRERHEEWERRRQALHAYLLQQEQDVQSKLDKVSAEKQHKTHDIEAEHGRVDLLRASLEAARGQGRRQDAEIDARHVQYERDSQRAQAARGELAALNQELAKLEQTLEDLRRIRQQQQNLYSVVPYQGRLGDRRRPFYVECRKDGVIFHPGKIVVPAGPMAWAGEVRRTVEQMVHDRSVSSPREQTGQSPYLLMLIRPDGIDTYYHTLAALAGFKADYGYELIEADWALDFPEREQQLSPQPWMAKDPSKAPRDVGISSAASNAPSHAGMPIASGSVSANTGAAGPGSGPTATTRTGVFAGAGSPSLAGATALSPGTESGGPGQAVGNGNSLGWTAAAPGPRTAASTGTGLPFDQQQGTIGLTQGGALPGTQSANAGGGPSPVSLSPGDSLQSTPSAGASGGSSAVSLFPATSGGNGAGMAPVTGAAASNGLAPSGGGQAITPALSSGMAAGGQGSGIGSATGVGWTATAQGASAAPGTGIGLRFTQPEGNGGPAQGSLRPAIGNASAGCGPAPVSLGPATPGNSVASGANAAAAGPSNGQTPPDAAVNNTVMPENGAAGGPPGGAANPPAATLGAGTELLPPVARIGVANNTGSMNGPSDGEKGSGAPAGSSGGGSGDGGGTEPGAFPFAGSGSTEKSTASRYTRPARLYGNRDWIITVACTRDGVELSPSGLRFTMESLGETSSGANAIFETVRQLIARRQAALAPGEPPYRPQIHFLVRSDGLRAYYLAYPALEALQVPMAREDIDQRRSRSPEVR